MDHQARESRAEERQTTELQEMLICKAMYCKGKPKQKPAYVALSYDLYVLKEKRVSQRPTELEQFRDGLCVKLDQVNVNDSEDIILRNSNLERRLASRALLISTSPSTVIIFEDVESRNRWFSAIRRRTTQSEERINQTLQLWSMSAKNGATTISNVSSAANGIANVAGTAKELASALGGLAIVGPVLTVTALLLSAIDRGFKTKEEQSKLPKMKSRLQNIWKCLTYALDVLLAADKQNQKMEKIMKKILRMFDECSVAMGHVERHLMKTTWKQYLSADSVNSIENQLAQLEAKLDLTHIVELVKECNELEKRLNVVEDEINDLKGRSESDSPVISYASVPNIPNGVVHEAVPRYEELKKLLLKIEFPEICKRSVAIQGEGGTGKSMTCVMLANDKEIRQSFCEGIHFIKVGYEWSKEMVLQKVANVVENSGGVKVAKRMREELKAGKQKGVVNEEEVMRIARNWMEGKKVLVVADNVWDLSIVKMLSELAVASESGFLFTTRSNAVAGFAREENQFQFSAFRAATPGAERNSAILIFDGHLGSPVQESSREYRIRDELLKKVPRLALAIASAGRLVKACGWDDVLSELDKFLQEEDPSPKPAGDHPGLRAIWKTSLSCLDNPKKSAPRESVRISESDFAELKEKHGPECFRKMYLALVVLSKKQPSAPTNGTLSQLWGLSKNFTLTRKVARAIADLSLAAYEEEAGAGQLRLHDMQYQYCESTCGRNGETPAWQLRMNFLSSYCENESHNDPFQINWAEKVFYPPEKFPTWKISGNVDMSYYRNSWNMVVSLTPRDCFLAAHLEEILESIASDSACKLDVAEGALKTAGSLEKQYEELATIDDPQRLSSAPDPQLLSSAPEPENGAGAVVTFRDISVVNNGVETFRLQGPITFTAPENNRTSSGWVGTRGRGTFMTVGDSFSGGGEDILKRDYAPVTLGLVYVPLCILTLGLVYVAFCLLLNACLSLLVAKNSW